MDLRCIFCKQVSEKSTKVEHIIPESLGNKEHILPKGIVCDLCNQYFGTKIEKPLLEQPFFTHLRHRQLVPTKHNRSVGWKMYSLFPVQNPEKYLINKKFKGKKYSPLAFQDILSQGNLFYSPYIHCSRPDDTILSRFLAKVAIEVMTQRICHNRLFIEELTNNEGLDPLREYARYGKGGFWPYSHRIIYDENTLFSDHTSTNFQIVHEYNIISFLSNE